MNPRLRLHIRDPIRHALDELTEARRYAKGVGHPGGARFPVLAAKIELALEAATMALRHVDDMEGT